jgi:hypothetical protein
LGRSNSTYEKRRRELEKKKKREAKQQAKAERKAAREARGKTADPVITLDEFGNVVVVEPDPSPESDAAEDEAAAES